MIGQRLGPYEITGKLGQGGMGEVYRATDSKLKREVAIKVLPSAFTADEERLKRFEREAQVLAQLHHPNIASIFGLEESGGTRALVMELVEGPTLAERLDGGAFSIEESLAVARGIAQALEAAHEKGIVHRDLKPQNVKASTGGTVKVLDFGLAKAMGPASGAGSQLAQSPTITFGATELGVVLGTAAYMAPEQARGLAVDKRADIWAFGVVLHEMLTGRSLFAGETVTDTLAGVLRAEIDLGQLPATTPPAIRRLLRRCLERNPKNRLHDIADARIVLEELERGGVEDVPSAAASPLPSGRGRVLPAVAAGLALALGVGLGWLLRRPAPESPAAAAHWALAIPDGLTLSTGSAPQLAISADGRYQVAVVVDASSVSHLLLRSMDTVEPRLLPETAGATGPFFSPDGAWIGFFRAGSLSKIPVAGGPAVEVAKFSSAGPVRRGATWSVDQFIYFSPNVGVGLRRVSENGGAVEQVTELDGERDERTHRWPQALPGGSAVLFTSDTQGSTEYYDDARIEAVRPATGERRVLVEGSSQARYGGGDRLIFARGGSLFAVTFDPRTLSVSGVPQPVVRGVATDVASGAVQFDLSPSGAALWAPGGLSAEYRFFWIDRAGVQTAIDLPPEPYNEAQLAPDGRRVALVGGPGGIADLWVADLERGTHTRLTSGESISNPVWSPDSTRVVYLQRGRGERQERRWRIASKLADGSRAAEILLDAGEQLTPSGFTPDGRQLLYASTALEGSTSNELRLLELAAARSTTLLTSASPLQGAVVSPDGRWLAYSSAEAGAPEVYVRPFPAGEGRWQISAASGSEPRWSTDQRQLFFRATTTLWRVDVETRNGFKAGRAIALLDRLASSATAYSYTPARDGRIFTPRSPGGRGSLRTVYLDLGFARRLAELGKSH